MLYTPAHTTSTPVCRPPEHRPTRSWRQALIATAAALACAAAGPALAVSGSAKTPPAATLSSERPSPDVQALQRWVKKTGDNRQGPFMVLDKRKARLWVFDRHGQPVANSPVLLGAATGDDSVPGIGERPIGQILPHERTTPAGRYRAEPGVNAKGEDIFWVDYDVAVSLHRVQATNPKERRLERLATPTETDNRISYGCINVPVAFYDNRVRPLFTQTQGWIYVLPETRPVQTLFQPAGAVTPAG